MKARTWIVPGLSAAYIGVQISLCLALVNYNGSEGVYWQTLRQMAAGRKLYSEIFYSQWPLFIELARLSRFLPGFDLYTARLILMLFSPLALYAAYRLGRKLISPRAGLITAGLLAIEPLFFNLSHQLTGEIPALALTLLAQQCLLDPPFRKPLLNTLAAGVLFAIAIQIKILMALPFLLTLLVFALFTRGNQRLKVPLNLGIVALAINIFCLWLFDWFNARGMEQLQGGLVARFLATSPGFDLPHLFATVLFSGDYSRSFLFILAPGLLLALPVLYKDGRHLLVQSIALSAGVILLVLAFYIKLNTDHLLLYAPLCAFALAALAVRRPKGGEWALTYFATISLFLSGEELGWGYPHARKREPLATKALVEATSENTVVMGNALFLITSAGRLTPPEYADFSAARAVSGSLSCAEFEKAFQNSEIKAFALLHKGLHGLPCEGRLVADVVKSYFPKLVYEDPRYFIFVRD